jgi:flagellar biosynthetic protein FliP
VTHRALPAVLVVLGLTLLMGADGPSQAHAPGDAIDLSPAKLGSSLQTVVLFAVASLAPAAILMVTAFVRTSVVLALLRQALGSPQVPGNQVMMALALLLTALVMRPQAEAVYTEAVRPLLDEKITTAEAWDAGSRPIKEFMVEQIYRTGHEQYLADLNEYASPGASPGEQRPTHGEDLPFRVVAPAFLLSELTTALVMGFAIYLPFLVIDLVVSSVLAAMGLVMLPPSLVAPPLKLIVFVLAGGWWLVADMLLRSFGLSPGA